MRFLSNPFGFIFFFLFCLLILRRALAPQKNILWAFEIQLKVIELSKKKVVLILLKEQKHLILEAYREH